MAVGRVLTEMDVLTRESTFGKKVNVISERVSIRRGEKKKAKRLTMGWQTGRVFRCFNIISDALKLTYLSLAACDPSVDVDWEGRPTAEGGTAPL